VSRRSRPAARRTLFDIERERRWRVWLLFALLVAMVDVAVWIACLIVAVAFYLSFPVVDTVGWVLRPQVVLLILGVSLGLSVLYWFAAQVGARGRLLRALHCAPLDPGDRYHQRLASIVEEMRLATGGPPIQCRTVPTLGLNAFAFSDLRGGGVIGVTEGALSRLSRQQLEAVVAHEFAHVLSGNYVTVTVSCLLFGVYEALGEELEEAMLATAATRAVPVAFGALLLRGWLWVLQLASSITSAALSRERERHADLAAVRYTRDPLSLAEALRIISRHPGGAGSIPEGLAPLCIRQTGEPRGRLLGLRRETHPPIGQRIGVLLALAHVAPSDFERHVEEAGERFHKREHWAAPPAATGGPWRGLDELLPLTPSFAAAVATAVPPAAAASLPAKPSRAAGARPVWAGGVMSCPACGHSLEPADYEGMRPLVCRGCGGRLATEEQVKRIVARREVGFTPDQEHLADVLAASGDRLRRAARLARGRPGVPHVPCPRCGKSMMRGHYDYEYAVEVDRCVICGLVWFERNELEALQILTERATG
jgi:Zn-dependent protease with chaperone function/Zn-finger nucleic acid-binding protein